MVIREAQSEQTITLVKTDLFDAVCVALEGDEFRQIRGLMRDDDNGRCAWGVAETIGTRAGYRHVTPADWDRLIPRVISFRAAALLGHAGLVEANDAGVSFVHIAAALRQARVEVTHAVYGVD